MDRLDAMAVFVETVECGSLSTAARKLSLPLTTVSRNLAELEAHLGVQLLTRSTRRLALTEAGHAYLVTCRQVLDLVRDGEDGLAQVHQQPRGALTLTAPLVFGRIVLLPLLADFLADFPEIDIRLQLGDQNLDLIDQHIDLALRIGALPDSNLRAVKVGDVREVVCGSPAHFQRHGTPQAPDDLQRHPCITFTAIERAGHWTFSKGRQRHPVAVRSRLVVNTAEAAIDAAISGIGVTRVLSYQVREALDQGRLTRVLSGFEPEPLPVNLLFPAVAPMPLKLRAVIDHLVPRLRERLGYTV